MDGPQPPCNGDLQNAGGHASTENSRLTRKHRPFPGDLRNRQLMLTTRRKHPAHYPPVSRNQKPVVVFVTLCANKGSPSFAHNLVHESLKISAEKFQDWKIGQYVIMPDHMHFFCAPSPSRISSLEGWIRTIKRWTSRLLHAKDYTILWQADYWDTQIRNGKHLIDLSLYMNRNPINAGLCVSLDDWLFSGELFEIPGMLDFDL